MRTPQKDNSNPFQEALKKKAKRKGFDPKSAGMAHNARRNARQMPTRQLNRGR